MFDFLVNVRDLIAFRRSKVATAKQSMDVNHLQLENLLYERDHLSRETQLCKDFT